MKFQRHSLARGSKRQTSTCLSVITLLLSFPALMAEIPATRPATQPESPVALYVDGQPILESQIDPNEKLKQSFAKTAATRPRGAYEAIVVQYRQRQALRIADGLVREELYSRFGVSASADEIAALRRDMLNTMEVPPSDPALVEALKEVDAGADPSVVYDNKLAGRPFSKEYWLALLKSPSKKSFVRDMATNPRQLVERGLADWEVRQWVMDRKLNDVVDKNIAASDSQFARGLDQSKAQTSDATTSDYVEKIRNAWWHNTYAAVKIDVVDPSVSFVVSRIREMKRPPVLVIPKAH